MLTRPILAGLAALALASGCAQTPDPVTTNEAPTTPAAVTTEAPEPTEAPVTTSEPAPTTEVPTQTAEPTATEPTTAEPTATDTSDDAAAPQPTWGNVPNDAEVNWPVDPTPLTWVDAESLGQAATGLCDPGEYGDPTTVLRRDFFYEEDGSPAAVAVVFGYDSTEAATAGYDAIANAAANCEGQLAAVPLDNAAVTHDTELEFDPSSVDAEAARADHFTAMGIFPDEDSGLFNISMVVQVDNRVAWLVDSFEGQDHNCSVTSSDDVVGQCRLPAHVNEVAERLAVGR